MLRDKKEIILVSSESQVPSAVIDEVMKVADESSTALLIGIMIGFYLVLRYLRIPEKVDHFDEKLEDIERKLERLIDKT